MKLKIIIIGLVLILIVLIILPLYVANLNKPRPPYTQAPTPIMFPGNKPRPPADFLVGADRLNPNKPVTIYQNTDYVIIYQPGIKRFILRITASPFDQVRLAAETKLLSVMAISQKDACRLKVDEVDATAKRIDIEGLSFCAD